MQLEETAIREFLSPLKGRQFRLPNGSFAFGLVSKAPPFDPNTPLGADPREKAVLELNDPVPAIAMNDRITDLTNKAVWEVVHRDANPADFSTTFVLARIVPGLDS